METKIDNQWVSDNTLDEAIQHLNELLADNDFGCDECKQEHQELLLMLQELKQLREAEKQADVQNDADKGKNNNNDETEDEMKYRQKHRIIFNKYRLSSFLRKAAHYTSLASWGTLAIFIVGRISQIEILTLIGVVAAIVSMALSIIAEEIANKIEECGHGILGVLLILGAVGLSAFGLYGCSISNMEYISGGLLGIFVLCFVPLILDAISEAFEDLERSEACYDENGNWNPPENFFPNEYHVTSASNAGNVFHGINEIFGVPQPEDPPPIEISRDDIEDDVNYRPLNENKFSFQ